MSDTAHVSFRYEFRRAGRDLDPIVFDVLLDKRTLQHVGPSPDAPPRWAKMDNHRCEGCQLDPAEHAYCPAALSIVELVERFDSIFSYSEVQVIVDSPERQYRAKTSVQRALSSLVGLYMATSGCPALAPFRAMARFHLPFASREETIFRAASSYLLAQYFKRKRGESADLDLDGLRETYDTIHHINMALANRLRDVSRGDANLNALVLLDLYAQDLPLSIDGNLDELETLFQNDPPAATTN